MGTLLIDEQGQLTDEGARQLLRNSEESEEPEAPVEERISPDDQMLVDRLNDESRAVKEHYAFVFGHLSQKYRLGPKDGISDDGRIIREAEAPQEQPD